MYKRPDFQARPYEKGVSISAEKGMQGKNIHQTMQIVYPYHSLSFA
jgi:hypothetical protein